MENKATTVQSGEFKLPEPTVSLIFEGYEWDDITKEPVPVYVLVAFSSGEGCQVPEVVS